MEAEDPLSQLADIHLPDAVTLWPPAPGWWVLAALVLVALAFLCRQQLRRLLVRRRMNNALGELEQAYHTWRLRAEQGDDTNQAGLDLLYGFNAVLKRVALAYCPQSGSQAEVPRLTGEAWLQFLDRTGETTDFTAGAGQALGHGTYQPVFNADAEGLHALCRRWIRQRYLKPAREDANATSDSEVPA